MEGIGAGIVDFDREMDKVKSESQKYSGIWQAAQNKYKPEENQQTQFNPQDPNTWIHNGKKVSEMSLDELIEFSTDIYNQASIEYKRAQEVFTIASLNLQKATAHYEHYQSQKKKDQIDGNKGLAALLGNQIESDLSDIESYNKNHKSVQDIINERLKNEQKTSAQGQEGSNQTDSMPTGNA